MLILTFEDYEENMIDRIVSCGDGMAFVQTQCEAVTVPAGERKSNHRSFEALWDDLSAVATKSTNAQAINKSKEKK